MAADALRGGGVGRSWLRSVTAERASAWPTQSKEATCLCMQASSDYEFDQLDTFLLSDATPYDCVDILALDGFLTALAIGPGLVPPSARLPSCLGRQRGADFRIGGAGARHGHADAAPARSDKSRLGPRPAEFEPILHVRSMEGKEVWIADDWCSRFMRESALRSKTASPLLEDPERRALLFPTLVGRKAGSCLAQMTILTPPSRPCWMSWRLRLLP